MYANIHIYIYMYINTSIIHVHSMYTVCPQYVHNMYTVCTQSVHSMYTVCTQYVHSMYTVCVHIYICIHMVMQCNVMSCHVMWRNVTERNVMYVRICTYIYIHIYIYIYIYIYTYIYTYIHIYRIFTQVSPLPRRRTTRMPRRIWCSCVRPGLRRFPDAVGANGWFKMA